MTKKRRCGIAHRKTLSRDFKPINRLSSKLASNLPAPREHSDFRQLTSDVNLCNYNADIKAVVSMSDVILQVLDARDPLGTRSESIEQLITASSEKRHVFVINKADLVPTDNVREWKNYLRQYAPVVAIRSSTQHQKGNLGRSRSVSDRGSRAAGLTELTSLLANYSRVRPSGDTDEMTDGLAVAKKPRNVIRVGVVGCPNVGKSSLINSLKRTRSCAVGNKSGVTKNVIEVRLDSKIRLIDSPGVLQGLPSYPLSCLNVQNVDDPVSVVSQIVARCSAELLATTYDVRPDSLLSVDHFLSMLATNQGKLLPGGLPNVDSVARQILTDWTLGRIRYFSTPPAKIEANPVSTTVVVSQLKPAFDLASWVPQTEKSVLANQTNIGYHPVNGSTFQLAEKSCQMSSGPVHCDVESMSLKNAKRLQERLRKKQRKRQSKLDSTLAAGLHELLAVE